MVWLLVMLIMAVKQILSMVASGRRGSINRALARGSSDSYFGGLYQSVWPIQAEEQRKHRLQASTCHILNLLGG